MSHSWEAGRLYTVLALSSPPHAFQALLCLSVLARLDHTIGWKPLHRQSPIKTTLMMIYFHGLAFFFDFQSLFRVLSMGIMSVRLKHACLLALGTQECS